ncbi:MAG TPA: PAS domain S-box protein [Bryobacteraceae bacterium]|nr:PAS domain S-box protein [Bryobacteraceae bacterium]
MELTNSAPEAYVLAAALESAPDSVLVTDRNGAICWVNPAFCALTGYGRQELIGTNPRWLKSGCHEAGFYQDLWNTILSRRTWRGEITNRRKDGTLYTQELWISPVQDQDQVITHFVGVGRDVRDRKQSEELLARSEEHFRRLVESAPEGIFVHSEGVFSYLNPAALRLFGAGSADRLLGHPMIQQVHPAFHSLVEQRLSELKEGRHNVPLVEEQFVKMDGTPFDVEVSAIALNEDRSKTLVFFRDISEHKKAQDADRRSRGLLNSVIEGTTDAVYVKDCDGRFLLVNGAACKMVGKRAEEILGRDDRTLFSPETAEQGMAHDRRIMTSRRVESCEDELVLATGERILIQKTEGPVFDGQGNLIGIFGMSRDITSQKRSEEERAKLWAQLLQAQKMESVGRMAGGVAHDFNNLLTVINGYSALLLQQITPEDPIQEPISEIRKAGARAAALSRQLLVLSREQVVRPKVLDLNEVIGEVEKMLGGVLGEDIRIETRLSPSLGPIRADAGQFHQVLVNLIVNARDAMPGGGKILIETLNMDLDQGYALQHPELAPGPYVLMTVSDDGLGMSEDVRSHLFEPFFTTKKQSEGTGLGLATVYGIIKQTGGAIFVYSEPGAGATFKIYLPRVDEAIKAEDETKTAITTLRGTETVLVVEDQQELRRLAAAILRRYGYEVLEAVNADEALVHAERLTRRIHLMVTDLVMPGMTGPELAVRLSSLRPDMKIIFMSGYAKNAIADRGILDSNVPYLPKPFSPEALASIVREALGAPGTVGTILVVDDDPAIRSFLGRVLSGAGYRVLGAKDGKEAVQHVNISEVDLMITDLIMPEQEGLETIQILHRLRPGLKIIAISGKFGGQFLRVAKLFGARATLTKPVLPDQLLEAVRQVLGSSL